MIVRHSLKLLEQLSELEQVIQQIEHLMDEKGVDCNRELVLLKLLKGREAQFASRPGKKID